MSKIKKSTSKKIYWFFLIISIIVGFIFYTTMQDQFSLKFRVFFSGIPFFLFVIGCFGLLWPKLKPEGDEIYIIHALMIGVLFIILFFIHTWIILPHLCEDFASCLGL